MTPRIPMILALLCGPTAAQEDLTWARHPEPAVRERGLRDVKRRGLELDASLVVRLLRDRDWGVQLEAIRTFETNEHPKVRETFVDLAMNGPLLRTRRTAAQALAATDRDGAAKALLKELSRLGVKGGLRAVEALGLVGSPLAEKRLSVLALSSDADVCRASARALGRIRLGTTALIRALSHSKEGVVFEAAVALANIDSDEGRAALIQWAARNDEPWVLRRIGQRTAEVNGPVMGRALSRALLKSRRPAGLLRVAWEGRMAEVALAAREHLGSNDPMARGYAFLVGALIPQPFTDKQLRRGLDATDTRVRQAAARAQVACGLRGKRLAEALPPLLTHDSSDVAMVGVRAVFEHGVQQALPALLDLARGRGAGKGEWEIRCAAAVAAGTVGGIDALPVLSKLTGSTDWHLRGAALEGLARTMHPQAIPFLIKAHNDNHPVPQRVARRNLWWMSGGRVLKTRKAWTKWWQEEGEEFVPTPPRFEEPRAVVDDGYDRRLPRDYVRRLLLGTDISVLLGRWDRVQLVLQSLDVVFDMQRGQQLRDRGVTPKETVCINCEGGFDKATNEMLRWMVVCGGWLATSDWALVNTVKKTFPDVVTGFVKRSTGNDLVHVEPAVPNHPLLTDVFRPHVDYTWWLEVQAFPITVADPFRATVLMDSLEMRLKYGQDTMMALFPAGLGQVLHTTSHFYLQQEGMAQAGSRAEREAFAIDHLGISIANVRALRSVAGISDARNTTALARDYSMFRLLINFLAAKKATDRR